MKTIEIQTIEGQVYEVQTDGLLVDNDGTLVETSHVISKARARAFSTYGFTPPPDDVLHGKHDADVLAIAVAAQGEEAAADLYGKWTQVCALFMEFSLENLSGGCERVALFPDVNQSTVWTHIPFAIVSNAHADWFNALAKNPRLGAFYENTAVHLPQLNVQHPIRPKPAPDLLHHAARSNRFRAPLMIGDTAADLDAACLAQCPVVIVDRLNVGQFSTQPKKGVYVVSGFQALQVRV